MGILKDKLQQYAERLKDREDYFLSDIKRIEYFSSNASNSNDEEVRQKLSLLNHHDIHDLACHEEMIDHIIDLDIDKFLKNQDLAVVELMARFHYKGKEHYLIEFASSYCNSHHPEVYPIFSRDHIKLLEQYMDLHVLLESDESLESYLVYKRGLDLFLDHHDLKDILNYYEVGKLEWLYFDKLLSELVAQE